jgi:hypothetical protein
VFDFKIHIVCTIGLDGQECLTVCRLKFCTCSTISETETESLNLILTGLSAH